MGFKKVCVLLLAACVVITLVIIFAALYVNRGDFRSKRTYTFEDFYNETIRYKTHSIRWISDKEYLHKTSEGHVYLHDAETATKTVYLRNATFGQVDATDYLLSADKRFVAFESNYSKQWRHSFNASYHIYDLQAQEFLSTVQIPAKTQLFVWAPTGNKMAYVWNYNIYLKRNVTAEAIQATHDGKDNQILNGVPDWAYEEEILASNEALWWSPGGKFLAYLQINDTGVHQIEFSLYGNEQYPTTVFIPYSKAGCTIPRAKLFVIDTENPSAQSEFPAPKTIGAGDHYVSSVTWITDQRLAVQWMPRRQDQVLLQIYQHEGGGVWSETSSFEQKSRTGWVGRFFPLPPYFAADNSSFYKVMSDERGYKHLHYVTAGKATPITSGQWEVIYISKVTKDAIYYVSNEHEGRAGQRNLYKVSVTAASHSAAECVTCSLRPERCQYNSAYFSMDASFFRMDCYGPGLPLFILMDNRGSAKELRVLEDNKKLEEILTTELLMPTIRRATLKIAGFNLWYQMKFPPNFDSSRKYPLLIQVYGGPASQNTDYVFRLEWATYLCSTEGVVIASFDGRGSGFQGDEIMHAIYGRLGTYEVEDQISAVRKFIEMGFIDESKIAIWGWSYGGYVTSMVLSSGSGLFSCGIAVAPVAKWEYYDAVYTERYMHKPEENAESYRNSSVTDRVRNMKSVRYMLVHGTADDNVHFQQAAQISKALVENQVDFEAMWYTDKDHGLSGKARVHLYTHLNRFLQTCFRK